MNKIFEKVPIQAPQRNVFDLSYDHKLSTQMGWLVPVMYMDCMPGDKITVGCESITRFAPLVTPPMHRFDITVHYWAVPYRLLWDGWPNFITNQPREGEDVIPAHPFINVTSDPEQPDWVWTRLLDHFGIPEPPNSLPEKISPFALAAYQFIVNENYRDQNLIPEINYKLDDGDNNNKTDLRVLRRRAWEHDYFTSALPFAQKGADVDLPLGEVELKNNWDDEAFAKMEYPRFVGTSNEDIDGDLVAANTGTATGSQVLAGANVAAYDPSGSLVVGATTIRDLRTAYALQRYLELAARSGTRYTEYIRAMFNVTSSDARQQRPEYITGVKSPIVISEVLNNTGIDGERPQGDMAGHGVGVVNGKYGSYFCEEHCCIIGIMSIMPKTAYQQGIPKAFLKTEDPFQYYTPQFAHIGEQPIYNREIYAYQGDIAGSGIFGYVPRYVEYKFNNNTVSGQFRSTLNFWHAGRIFATPPALNQEFIECNPTTRIFANENVADDNMWVHILNKVKAVRPMPFYGNPI